MCVCVETKLREKKRQDIQPSLLLANVRSLPSKMDELEVRLPSMKPDIIVFTESWLDSSLPDSAVHLDNYTIIRRDRNDRGGGIICYVSNVFQVHTISSLDVPSLQLCSSELIAFYITSINLIVICIYHPFWGDRQKNDEAVDCITDLIDFAVTSLNSNHPIKMLVCGDFNDLRHSYDYISHVTDLVPLVKHPTRADHILDQIFSNFSSHSTVKILPPLGSSDHSMVFLTPPPPVQPLTIKRRVRCPTRRSLATFREMICSTDWVSIVQSFPDIHDASESFFDILSDIEEHCFPLRTVRFRSSDPPWVRPSLKFLIDRRDRAFSDNKKAKYLRLREEVKEHVKYLKSRHLQSISNADSRGLWRTIKMFGRNKKSTTAQISFSPEVLNDFFTSTFQPSTLCSLALDDLPETSLRVTKDEVLVYMKKLKKRSSGPDKVPYWILRDFAEIFAEAITQLFNRSLSEGVVPRVFKAALITPIPKLDKPTSPSDYRPISRLPILSKVLERLFVNKFLMPHLKDRISSSQFAYVPRAGSGTTSALTLLNDHILRFLDTPGAVRILSADYSKAFDKIGHDIILKAMANFNFPKAVVTWAANYLSDRSQRVQVGNVLSKWSIITSGVPQGSIVGPLLFILATDSFSTRCTNSQVIRYADDISIVHFIRNESDDRSQLEWSNLEEWSNAHSLPLNCSKCVVMDFATKRSLCLSDIKTTQGHTLPNVSTFPLLGVVFSSDLKWNVHVNRTIKKASRRIFIIRNLKRAGCSSSVMYSAYVAFIRSVLLYCYPVFCNIPSYLFNCIARVERRVFRIIGDEAKSLMSFESAARQVCENLFDDVLKNVHHPLRSMFVNRIPTCRNPAVLKPPFARTVRFKNSFVRFGA